MHYFGKNKAEISYSFIPASTSEPPVLFREKNSGLQHPNCNPLNCKPAEPQVQLGSRCLKNTWILGQSYRTHSKIKN